MSEIVVELMEEKNVALIAEFYYAKHKHCPHCQSEAKMDMISDCKEMPEQLVDIYQCVDCLCVTIIVAFPQIFINSPVFLRWNLTKKGVRRDDQEQKQSETTEGEATGNPDSTGTEHSIVIT